MSLRNLFKILVGKIEQSSFPSAMSTGLVKVTPTNLNGHSVVRDALRVVKDEKVCVYRNGLLKGLMDGRWIIMVNGPLLVGPVESATKLYLIKNPIKAEAASEVFACGSYDDLPPEAIQVGQSDYLILKVLV